jgi:hypothetical protein
LNRERDLGLVAIRQALENIAATSQEQKDD